MIVLESPPRLNQEPGSEDAKTVGRWVDEIVKYLERIKRVLARAITVYNAGSTTYDPPNLVAGTGTTATVTVPGATLGEAALASFSLDLQGVTITPYVSAANTVSVRFQNGTGGAVDLASGTLRAWSFQPPQS